MGGVLDNVFMYARVLPKKKAKLTTKQMSMNKNCKSVKFESMEYSVMTDRNSVREYATINLKIPNEVTRAARPSRITFGTQVMSDTAEVKGLATLQDKEGEYNFINER